MGWRGVKRVACSDWANNCEGKYPFLKRASGSDGQWSPNPFHWMFVNFLSMSIQWTGIWVNLYKLIHSIDKPVPSTDAEVLLLSIQHFKLECCPNVVPMLSQCCPHWGACSPNIGNMFTTNTVHLWQASIQKKTLSPHWRNLLARDCLNNQSTLELKS